MNSVRQNWDDELKIVNSQETCLFKGHVHATLSFSMQSHKKLNTSNGNLTIAYCLLPFPTSVTKKFSYSIRGPLTWYSLYNRKALTLFPSLTIQCHLAFNNQNKNRTLLCSANMLFTKHYLTPRIKLNFKCKLKQAILEQRSSAQLYASCP